MVFGGSSSSRGKVNGQEEASNGEASAVPPLLAGCGNLPFSARAGRIGLRNLGNTCFMNAGLQCLSHIEPLASYFLSGQFEEDLNPSNPLGCKGELASSFAELQKTLWQGNRSSHDPKGLHKKLARTAPHLFEGYEQQDVQEFLAFCLDGLHEDLNRVTQKGPPPLEEQEKRDEKLAAERGDEFAAALAWARHLQRDKSFLVDSMQGQLQSSVICSECGYHSRRFDPFLYLSVPVTKRMTKVTDAIEKFLEEESLTGDEQWYCEKCKKRVDARKKINLWKLPPVLVLHLKRFEFDPRSMRFRKIDATLKAPEVMDLSAHCSSSQRHGGKYDIVCVANHSGSLGTGHYTATCRVGCANHGSWHHFDDDSVSAVKSGCEVVGREAYVVFLVRCNSEDASTGPGAETMVRRQTVTMPELWPHWVATRQSAVEALMQQLEDTPQPASPKAVEQSGTPDNANDDASEAGSRAGRGSAKRCSRTGNACFQLGVLLRRGRQGSTKKE